MIYCDVHELWAQRGRMGTLIDRSQLSHPVDTIDYFERIVDSRAGAENVKMSWEVTLAQYKFHPFCSKGQSVRMVSWGEGTIMNFHKVVLSAAAAAFALAATATTVSAGGRGSTKDGPYRDSGGSFGELTGTYIVDAGNNDWVLFGPDVVPGMTQGGLGEGVTGRAMVGYRVGLWDVALAAQLGVLGDGDPSTGSGQFATLEADYRAFDAMIGYNTRVGSAKTRLAVGVRIADWDNTVSPGGGRSVFHNWDGLGPRAEVSASVPLSGPWSLQLGAGASYLWGDIKTTSSGGWICADCNNYSANSTNVDGSVGIGLQFAPGGTLVLGYRVEYWSDVNVAITDATDFGGNRGTSDHLIHGPFVSLKFGN